MCGIIGITSKEKIAEALFYGMTQLQHRGQDAAGIFIYDPNTKQHLLHKNRGLVTQVLTPDELSLSTATSGIGHIRYSTIGKGSVEDTQPLKCTHGNHIVAFSHNGNLVNYIPLKENLEQQGITFNSKCDAEAILHTFVNNLPENQINFDDICSAMREIFKNTSGAYSVVGIITGVGMIAFRDPWGFRPLLHGTQTKSHAFASETDSLNFLKYSNIDDVKPGEIVFVNDKQEVQRKQLIKKEHSTCSFEYNYFSKPSTLIENHEVYSTRSRLGKALAKKVYDYGIKPDVVVPVPDTARPSAIALAKNLNIDYEEGFVKRDHVGRTFIMPTQGVRKKAVSQKLAPVPSVFENKVVILVDDSIVRGTVSKKVVALARQAGAKEVYFASTYPPIRFPCIYGIDFPKQEQLIAHNRTIDDIANEIGVDGLIYNDVKDLRHAIQMPGICTACLTGDYPTDMEGLEELQELRDQDIKEMEFACKD